MRGLSGATVRDLDLDLHPGEVVGVAGLLGSGRSGRTVSGTSTAPAAEPDSAAGVPAEAATTPPGPAAGSGGSALARALSFRNMSAVYIFAVLFVVFALWTPESFLTAGTWRSLLDAEAITALAALAALVPLLTGSFNLAVGAEVGLGGILAATLLAKAELSVPVTVVLTLLVGAGVGYACSSPGRGSTPSSPPSA